MREDAGSRANSGKWWVELTAALEQNRTSLPHLRQPPQAALAEADVAALRELVETLRSATEAAAAAYTAELDRLRADRDQDRARLVQTEQEREEARIGRAVAEAEVKGLREALEEARRPFWRRWLGS